MGNDVKLVLRRNLRTSVSTEEIEQLIKLKLKTMNVSFLKSKYIRVLSYKRVVVNFVVL